MEAQSLLRWYSQLRALGDGRAPLHLAPVSVWTAIDHALLLLPAAAARVRVTVAEDVPPVAADQLWLTQVLVNLLDNAVRHTRRSDCVQIVAQRCAGDRVAIAVISPGSGIPVAEQPEIFRPYMRGSTPAGSAGDVQARTPPDDLTSQGLGLGIVHYFVTAMGGTIWVESDGQSSTTFVLILPIATLAPAASPDT